MYIYNCVRCSCTIYFPRRFYCVFYIIIYTYSGARLTQTLISYERVYINKRVYSSPYFRLDIEMNTHAHLYSFNNMTFFFISKRIRAATT